MSTVAFWLDGALGVESLDGSVFAEVLGVDALWVSLDCLVSREVGSGEG